MSSTLPRFQLTDVDFDEKRPQFARNVRVLRQRNNLTQTDVAALLDVSQVTVSSWEQAKSMPRANKLVVIATLFDVTLDQLLVRSERDLSS